MSESAAGGGPEAAAGSGRGIRLVNARLQRVLGEMVADPPFAVDSVSLSAAAPEVALSETGFACRFTYRVGLLDAERWDVGAVEVVLVLDFEAPLGATPSTELVKAFVDERATAIAVPYVREAVQSITARLGIALLFGLPDDSSALPTEIRLVGTATQLIRGD